MFRGFAPVSFYADDLAATQRWYADLFRIKAYYAFPAPPAPPAYVEFRVGDDQDEFGIIDRRPGPGGAVVYWHVDDLAATVERLLGMGTQELEPITERGEGTGFATASVVDPFGNILGVMSNPHWLEMLAARGPQVASQG